jgi:LAO/AO transport system kinase
VRTGSALTGDGVPELWDAIVAAHDRLRDSGALDEARAAQATAAMWSEVVDTLTERLRAHPGVRERLTELEAAVREGRLSPTAAAHDVLERFQGPTP